MSVAARAKLSYDDYLALERDSDQKHEYLDGFARAMAGGTIERARLTSRFDRMLGSALDGRPCSTFSADAKIRIEASNRTTYADVSVVCGKLERSSVDGEAIANPVVIVEVLSPSTEAYDRGEKFRHYRRLPSLREYVLISQERALVEVWRREGDAWRPIDHGPGEVVRLDSIDVTVAVDELYANPLEA
jgi:Uma2 family endonuclease